MHYQLHAWYNVLAANTRSRHTNATFASSTEQCMFKAKTSSHVRCGADSKRHPPQTAEQCTMTRLGDKRTIIMDHVRLHVVLYYNIGFVRLLVYLF